MDISREIRRAVDTGKVTFGVKQAEKNVLKSVAELIIISSNTPFRQLERIKHLCGVSEVPVYEFEGTGLTLGGVCGKPFVISVLCIEKIGKSKVMEAVKEKSKGKTI